MSSSSIKFGPFEVTPQVFLTTPHSFGLVNLKPLMPGHVLVCPLKPHPRLTDLAPAEVADLFASVQLVQRMLARVYFPKPEVRAGGFTVAVQDGVEAGQTVPHVHVHVIPRTTGETPPSDQIYVDMESERGNVGGALWDREARPRARGGVPMVEDESREARTEGEMNEEAERYRAVLRDMDESSLEARDG